jgi:hypothetical protein
MSAKTNLTWRERAKLGDEAFEKELKRNHELTVGSFDAEGVRPDTAPSLRGALAREMLDRGRVWRGCSIQTAADQQLNITLNTLGAGEDPATATPNQIEQDMVLYGFQENTDGNIRLFLGEFRATAVTDQTVTLAPTDARLLSAVQVAAVRAGGGWTLHEVLSADSHLAFSVDPRRVHRLTNTEGEKLFGDMDEEALRQIISQAYAAVGFPQDTIHPMQQKRIRDMLRDGTQAIINDPNNQDPVELIYTKVEFIKEYKELDVDTNEPQDALTSDYFDSLGRAVVDRLQRGDENPLSFAVGDVGVFHKEKADELINAGICNAIEPIFVRQTHDLNYELRALLLDAIRLLADIEDLKRVTKEIGRSNAQLTIRKAVREREQGELQADLLQFTNERDLATATANKLTVHRDKLLAQLSALYRSNAILAQQLAVRQKAIADDIKRREAAATAANN